MGYSHYEGLTLMALSGCRWYALGLAVMSSTLLRSRFRYSRLRTCTPVTKHDA